MTIDRNVDIKIRVNTDALEAGFRRANAALRSEIDGLNRAALGLLRNLGQLKSPGDRAKSGSTADAKAKAKAVKAELAEVTKFSHGVFDPIGRGFSQMISEMLRGTETFRMAWRRMLQEMVLSYMQSAIRIAIQSAEMETEKTIALALGLQTRQSMEGAAFAESMALHAAHALAWIAAEAAKVFASVFGFLAPAMGPAAAAPAAASMGSVLAVGSTVAFAAQGFDVRADTLAYLHKREMVLPAELADTVRGMAGGHGENRVAPNIRIHAMDGISVHRVLTANSGAVAAALRRHVRNLGR